MNKYGIENFSITMLQEVVRQSKEDLKEQLNMLEAMYINTFNTLRPNGYNLTKGGDNTSENKKRPVDAYDASGKLIFSFDSMIDAAASIANSRNNGILECCNGRLQSASGYVWRYHEDSFNKYPVTVSQEMLDRYNNIMPVDQYSLVGDFIASYSSVTEALKAVGKPGNTLIGLCCNGTYNQAYGYVWRKKGHPFNEFSKKEPADQSAIDVYSFPDGKFISTYSSINSGLRDLQLPENCHGSVVLNCQGQTKSVRKKYVFRYHGDSYMKYGDPAVRKERQQIQIYKYDLEGHFVSAIKSARDEAKKNHCSANSILNCCKGIRPNGSHEYNGFLWYYATDASRPDGSKVELA